MCVRIENSTIITLIYELRDTDATGELLEQMTYNWPLIFYFGSGTMLKSFEHNLSGLKIHDKFEFVLSPEEAYGEKDQELIVRIPLSKFKSPASNEFLAMPGEYVNLENSATGPLAGKVIEINANSAVIDCNHEMAGRHLHFKGVIVEIREATLEEHIQKRYIQPDGVRF